jgi:hypothetical protein
VRIRDARITDYLLTLLRQGLPDAGPTDSRGNLPAIGLRIILRPRSYICEASVFRAALVEAKMRGNIASRMDRRAPAPNRAPP